MTIKRDSIILGLTLKPVSLVGNFDWFAIEYTPTAARASTTVSGLDAVPTVAIRHKTNGPFTSESAIEVGSVVEQSFTELMFASPNGDDTIPLRLDVIRGTGRFHRRSTEMRAGFNVVAPRDLYRAGSKGNVVASGIGTFAQCTAALNPRGLLVMGGSLTACGDGANDGGAALVIDNGASSFVVACIACDKASGPVAIRIPTIEIPAGVALNLINVSAKDRGIVNVVVL